MTNKQANYYLCLSLPVTIKFECSCCLGTFLDKHLVQEPTITLKQSQYNAMFNKYKAN